MIWALWATNRGHANATALTDGNENGDTNIARCHGDCDSDGDCTEGLRCFQHMLIAGAKCFQQTATASTRRHFSLAAMCAHAKPCGHAGPFSITPGPGVSRANSASPPPPFAPFGRQMSRGFPIVLGVALVARERPRLLSHGQVVL